MPILEVRRHTMRCKPGQHLSQEGVDLAKSVGDSTGPFELVVTSEKARAIETAIAMGHAPTRLTAQLGKLPKSVLEAVSWPNSLENISNTVQKNEECRTFALEQAGVWKSTMEQLKDEQSALIITHGAIIELGAIGFLPNLPHSSWGEAIGYCEGFRFRQVGNSLTCEVLRMPAGLQLVQN